MSEPAAARLARIGSRNRVDDRLDDDDLAFLAECLGSAHKAVQRPAADVLAARAAGDARVRALLDRALDAPALGLRWGAVYALSRSRTGMPPGVLDVLLEVFGLADGDIRWAAAAIVVGMGAAPTVAALADLARDGNAAQRKMALYCLRDLEARTPEVLTRVHHALDDDVVGVRLAAMAAVARLAAPAPAACALVARLADADARLRRTAAATLGRLGVADAAVTDALGAAAEADDAVLARTARRSLDRLGDRLG